MLPNNSAPPGCFDALRIYERLEEHNVDVTIVHVIAHGEISMLIIAKCRAN
jgi:uncharacterized membrane protein